LDYFVNLELDIALKKYLEFIDINLEEEEIDVRDCYKRITSRAIYAKRSSPHYVCSAMDGIAVCAEKTKGATETTPVILEEGIDFIRVDTGDPVPSQYNAVIMLEDLIEIDNKFVKIVKGITPFQNIRNIGEDIYENEMIIPSNTMISAEIIGSLITCGIQKLTVFKKIRVSIIPTGDEIVEFNKNPEIGEIVESNSFIFSNMIKDWGGEVLTYKIIKDNYDKIKEIVKEATFLSDIVLIIAGSSKGRDDLSFKVINDLGEVIVHGIAIKPGKPAILGIISGKPVIGLPGYPVSGIVIMNEIVKKIFDKLNYNFKKLEIIKATIGKKIVSSLKSMDFVRTKIIYIDNNFIAMPSGSLASSLVDYIKADGIIRVPLNREGYYEDEIVEVELKRDIEEIKNSISIIGSNDLVIDEIYDIMKKKGLKNSITSINVGSMGGIFALKKRRTHLATSHLLDENDGSYNISYIKKYLLDQDIVIIKGVRRIQGFIFRGDVNLRSINDIVTKRLKYINRQKGSGTRILFDYLLKKEGISPFDIDGYDYEEFTHIAVGLQIVTGRRDLGLGIYSIAKMFNLNFLPVWEEEYDFITRKEYLDIEMIKLFLEILNSKEFKKRIENIGGYKCDNSGEIFYLR